MKSALHLRVMAAAACAACFVVSMSALGGWSIAQATAAPNRALVSPLQSPTGPDGGVWHAFGGLSEGCGGDISATALGPNGDLYVGGSFTICGNVPVSYVARWNGVEWSTLGSGVDSPVHAIAVSGSDVYVGGQIHVAGGVPVSGIARWDGTQWHALGGGVGGFSGGFDVNAIAISGSDVYVGGLFDLAGDAPVHSIARWNTGSQVWSTLGAGLTDNGSITSVLALGVLNGIVYAGGVFRESALTSLSFVAAWDGSNWSPLDAGFDSSVQALAVWNGALYAGGDFTSSGSAPMRGVARWDGSTWSDVGGSVSGSVSALGSSLAGLFVGGVFNAAGGDAHHNVALWNGSAWADLGGGVEGPLLPRFVSSFAAGFTGIYVGGSFSSVGDGAVVAHAIAVWNGSLWSALHAPPGRGLYALPVAAVTIAGLPCFGGYNPLYPAVGGIACWNGIDWTNLGGSAANSISDDAPAMLVDGSNLYLGASFQIGSGCCIGRWDGATWNALGEGIDSEPIAIAVDGSHVYVAGYFQMAGGVVVNQIAMWDGISWNALGTGIDSAPIALAFYQGKLYAAGYFDNAGGVPASHIAAWDGTAWTPVAGGLDGQGNALVVSGGSLYVSGYFSHAGVVEANSIARWDGTQWSAVTTPLGNGFTSQGSRGYVGTLVDSPLGLFAAGAFDAAGGAPANNIARIDPNGIHALGSGGSNGVDPFGYVSAVAVDGTDVFVGGVFGTVGGKISANVGRFATDEVFANGFE